MGFSSYSWLLRQVDVSIVAAFAYVNPVIALLLGWLVVDEEIALKTILAALTTLVGVFIIVSSKKKTIEN